MTEIIAGMVAFIKAVPIIDKWVQMFVGAWITSQVSQAEDSFKKIENKRAAVYKAIEEAENDSDRKALSVVLADLHN